MRTDHKMPIGEAILTNERDTLDQEAPISSHSTSSSGCNCIAFTPSHSALCSIASLSLFLFG